MQCPFCQRQVAQKTLETVVANNPGKISTTFQHFPLSFHTNAQPAAEAAECFKQETTTELFYDYIHDLFISKDLSTANLIAQATKR
jgi:protein-disulfide isomerase